MKEGEDNEEEAKEEIDTRKYSGCLQKKKSLFKWFENQNTFGANNLIMAFFTTSGFFLFC